MARSEIRYFFAWIDGETKRPATPELTDGRAHGLIQAVCFPPQNDHMI